MNKNWLVVNLNKKYFLKVGKKVFQCQIGEEGIEKYEKKTEGDKTTPIGKWYLKTIYYRPDKIIRPKLKKKDIFTINKITKNCGWCNDISSNKYNKYVKINNFQSLNFNYEKLWREDEAYDIIIVTSHNHKPTIKNKGSAIFIHCSFSNNRNTAGCIAIAKKVLIFLLKSLRRNTYIKIQN
tara:strand:- start:618 stop:1160 length:543 start_codon:yes stop_codon:yes gene_type:complete